MSKFLKDLEKELNSLSVSPKEIKEILEDHIEMIEAATQDGLNENEISLKFGEPAKIATEIYNDSINKESYEEISLDNVESVADYNTVDFTFVKTFSNIPEALDFNVSFVNEDFILSDFDGEGIQVYQNRVKNIDDYSIDLEGSELVLKKKKIKKILGSINFKSKSAEFLVLVPKGYKFNNLDYHTVSGDVVANQLFVNSFKLKSTNGDINLSNVNLGKANFSLVNGDIEIHGMKALSLDISLVNGDIEIEQALIDGDIYYNSVNGDVKLHNVECANASFKTVSGDVDGKNFYVKEISLKSISGDIEIQNDDKTREIKIVSKKTLSGDISINN